MHRIASGKRLYSIMVNKSHDGEAYGNLFARAGNPGIRAGIFSRVGKGKNEGAIGYSM